jgi:hypothetical protein
MTIQEIGTAFIVVAMVIAFFQKARDGKQQRDTPFLTWFAVGILIIVGFVDVWLWLLDAGTFTAHIKAIFGPGLGFLLMVGIFIAYWWKSDTVEALDVMFGILMGHFWWSW